MRIDSSDEGILRLIKSGESETVELKLKLPPDSQLARLLTSFANTSGGVLLIGVGDRSDIVGLDIIEALNYVDRLRKIGASLFNYSIEVGTKNFDGRNIVYAVIDPAPEHLKPIATSTGDIYQRLGDRTEKIPAVTEIKPSDNSIQLRGFVAMSFREEEEPALVDYFEAMKRATKGLIVPIKLVRVDLIEGDYEISQKIMDEISNSDFVLVDFTLSPRNVYFEVGFARGCKKPIIQTARKGTTLEFDTRNWRTIFYKNATELEVKLKESLLNIYKKIIVEDKHDSA